MAGYYHSCSVSSASANCLDELLGDDFYEEVNERARMSSSGASACALPSEIQGNTCAKSRPTNSRDHGKKTKSKSDYRITSESDRRNGLSAGSSADPRCGKKRRTLKNGRETSNVGILLCNDADDDFRDAKYRIPLAQRIGSTCENGVIHTSGQTLSNNSQHVETSGKAPSQNEVTLGQLGAKMPSTSRIIKRPHVPTVSFSASDDHFDVYEFFNNPSTVERRTKLSHGETSSRNAYKKQKSTNHKSSEEHLSGKLSSHSVASAMKNAPNTGSTNSEMQSASRVPTGMWDDPVNDILNGNIVQYSTESKETEVTSGSSGRVGSCADGNGGTKRRRFRLKRQRTDDDCLDKTFDMLDASNGTATQASLLPASSAAVFTDGTFALPCPKSVSTKRPSREKCSGTRRPSHDAAVRTLSSENACVSDIDVDAANMTGSGLRNFPCREDYQGQTAVTSSPSSSGASVSTPFSSSASDVRVDPYCRKKPRLCLTGSSSLNGGGGSSAFREIKVKRSVAESRSSAGSVVNRLEDAKNGESHGTGSGCQRSVVVKSSRQNLPATNRTNVQDTSGSCHPGTKSKRRSNSRGAVDGHRHKTAARSDGHLKRILSRGRAIIDDGDDADNLAADTNTTCAIESAVSSRDDVIIIVSDSEETAPTEYGSEQAGDSYRRPERSNVESGIAADGNSGTNFRVRPRRTARMSCRGG